MKTIAKTTIQSVIVSLLLGLPPSPLQAAGPSAKELDAAIKSGDFSGYLASATAWLDKKTPTKPSEKDLDSLLKDEAFRTALDQRHLIARTGADELGSFAEADVASRKFLGWLMKDTMAMDLYLEASVPVVLAYREQDTYALKTDSLKIWKDILEVDPEAKDAMYGMYLRMAIATAIAPPGSVNIGAGQGKPCTPVERYQHYKTAHKNKELLPSFDDLTVWEYTKVLSSGASNEDLAWAREMLHTWRPDLKTDEGLIRTTSQVWRRAAPAKFYPGGYQGFKNIMAGGGKCGPRSSWQQMIHHAFGVPSIGIGQPGHACSARRLRAGGAWHIAYGARWEVSRTAEGRGPEWIAGVKERAYVAEFSQVEHLRWLAAALGKPDDKTAVMAVAQGIRESLPELKPAPAAESKAPAGNPSPREPPAPVKAVDGVIHVEAGDLAKTGGKCSWGGQKPYVEVHDCYTGGKQAHFEKQMKEQWADYIIDAPASGTYEIVMKAACINDEQVLEVCSGEDIIATVPIPLDFGLWVETQPVEMKLKKGVQTLRVQTPTTEHKRGITLRWFKLKAQT